VLLASATAAIFAVLSTSLVGVTIVEGGWLILWCDLDAWWSAVFIGCAVLSSTSVRVGS